MKARKTERRVMGPGVEPPTCAPLAHPLRVRILAVTNERDISPRAFVDESLQQPGISFSSRSHALSHVSYHFRELQKAGCVEVVDTHQRRGAVEHIYRGTARDSEFTTEEFEKLPVEQRRICSRTATQALVARIDDAMSAHTLDSRTDRFMVVMPLELDEQGWSEYIALLDRCYAGVKRINDESGSRLVGAGIAGTPATYGMLGFESPRPPMPVSMQAPESR